MSMILTTLHEMAVSTPLGVWGFAAFTLAVTIAVVLGVNRSQKSAVTKKSPHV